MNRRRLAAIVLLIVGAGLFAIGTSVERNRHHNEPSAAVTGSGGSPSEASESAEQHQAEGSAGHSESSGREGKILGIDRESNALVVLAALISLALAALLWRRASRPVWLVTGVITLAFAVFDAAEIVHQLDGSAPRLAAIAVTVALAHVGTAGLAAVEVRRAS